MADATLTVSVAQTSPALGDAAGNLRRCVGMLQEAASDGSSLVVFPECAVTGYVIATAAEARELAEPVPGPATAVLAAACARLGLHCVAGLLERDGERVRNTAVLIGPGGLVGTQRKAHIARIGVDRFTTPGDDAYRVFETPIAKIGLQTCYEWRFPEVTRVLALGGAEIVAHPTNSPVASRDLADFIPRTRAVENAVYFLMANRVGTEGGTTFFGSSQIVDPGGVVLARAGERDEALISAEIDLGLAREKTKQPGDGQYAVRLFADRRPDLYTEIVTR